MSAQNLDILLRSRSVLVIGEARTPAQRGVLDRLSTAGTSIDHPASPAELRGSIERLASGTLAIVFDDGLLNEKIVHALGEAGATGILWTGVSPIPENYLQAARPHHLRFLGPRAAGFFHGKGMTIGAFASDMTVGQIALIAQSGSIATAAADWAAGRGIGFSWTVTTGGEADADIADFLDVAALDPTTRAVILQMNQIRNGRKFVSAARACARLKPVVVLQSGSRSTMGPDPVRSAAFARAGLVECATLDGLFDALAALARIPLSVRARTLTLGNGAGICALGVDAVRRHGLAPGDCSSGAFESVKMMAPAARKLDGAIDLGDVAPDALAKICGALLADEGLDYLLMVHSPSADVSPEHYVDALIAAKLEPRLVTVWLGLKMAGPARRRSAESGLSTFVTAGQAARALRYRWQHGRTREMLMQTPPVQANFSNGEAAARTIVDAAMDAGLNNLDLVAAAELLRLYGFPSLSVANGNVEQRFELELSYHPELGMHLSATAVSGLLRSATARGFPPLDALLIRHMLDVLGIEGQGCSEALLKPALLALSQLALDEHRVRRVQVTVALTADGVPRAIAGPRVELDCSPPPDRQRLILAPYPAALGHGLTARNGRHYNLRAIRPEDEPSLVSLLQRLRPEDVRMRFFCSIRHFSHEMAARMTQIDYDRELVMVVEPQDEPGALCAVAHLAIEAYGEKAEFAVLVHHLHARAGLGRLLMDDLLQYGRRAGLKQIYGEVLRQNTPMLALAHRLGFTCHVDENDTGCNRVELDLSGPAESVR